MVSVTSLIGKRFGHLLVVERGENRNNRPAWVCRCDCGKLKLVQGGNLKSGVTQSCGCMKGAPPLNLTGKRFEKLTAVCLISTNPPVWRCMCDCGREIHVESNYLRTGKKTHCGCLKTYNRQRAAAKTRKRPFESLYNSLKRRAVKKGLAVFSYEEFLSYTACSECHYCGGPIFWIEYNIDKGHASNLDRKDSNQGYIDNNVVVCCTRCNRGKSDLFTYDEWVKIGAFIKSNIRRVISEL
jgi:hypothetical protein